eukprot:gene420-7861_t
MGADGGTIPTRGELVKVKKKALKQDPSVKRKAKWKFCTMSAQRLQLPIVACGLGQLFNKEDLMKTILLVREGAIERPVELKHIKKLKDVHTLNLKPISSSSQVNDGDDSAPTQFECPITGLPMSGQHRFVFPVTCGCVVSERALKEVPTSQCLVCSKPFSQEDIVVINPDDDEINEMYLNMKSRMEMAKSDKKSRKSAATNSASSSLAVEQQKPSSLAVSDTSNPESDNSLSNGTVSSNGSSTNVHYADDMARFRKEAEIIKRRAQAHDTQRKRPARMKTTNMDVNGDELKWALSSKSVQDKPNASDVLKQLFHSHSKQDMNKFATFTSRNGYSMSHTWG